MEKLLIMLLDLGIFGGIIIASILLLSIIQISTCLIFNINILQTIYDNLFIGKRGVAKWQN